MNYHVLKAKGEFVKKYMNNDTLPYGIKLVAAAISEGIFFVGLLLHSSMLELWTYYLSYAF